MNKDTKAIQTTQHKEEERTSLVIGGAMSFEEVFQSNIDNSLATLSDKNRQEYEGTFVQWKAFAQDKGFSYTDFNLDMVRIFLTENDWTYNTRKTKFAHIRKFAQLIGLADVKGTLGFKWNYDRLALLKPKTLKPKEIVNAEEANHNHLSHHQVYKVFGVWQREFVYTPYVPTMYTIKSGKRKGEQRLNVLSAAKKAQRHENMQTLHEVTNVRNSAILAVMFMGALRVFEVAQLQWADVDFDAKTLYVRDGKGDKSGFIPMLGSLPNALKLWKKYTNDTQFVFTRILKSGKLGKDSPLTTQTLTNIVLETSKVANVTFKPHDARRTAITFIAEKFGIVLASQIARHADIKTTQGYIEKYNSKALGVKLEGALPYGDFFESFDTVDTDDKKRQKELI